MKEVEQCRYHSQSLWTITRFGHFLNAMLTGMAVLIPSFFAGMDAAVMMLLLSDGSPDTADGTSLMSGPPSVNNLTALQLRNAEFTSMWKMTRFMEKSRLVRPLLVFLFQEMAQCLADVLVSAFEITCVPRVRYCLVLSCQ